jgi:segregation and condensation protein B
MDAPLTPDDLQPQTTTTAEPIAEIAVAETPLALSDQSVQEIIEALVFASDESLTAKAVRLALNDKSLTDDRIDAAVNALNASYTETGRVFRIRKIAGGYRFLTEPQHQSVIQKLVQPKLLRRMSQSALETLAIIAYKQPLTKMEIENIRGVAIDYILKTLLEKNLIEVSGRSEAVGKPLLYVTTRDFLDYFNLHHLSDLPKPREISEIMKDEKIQQQLKTELDERLKIEMESEEPASPSNDTTEQRTDTNG